jgi:hypothetical protein
MCSSNLSCFQLPTRTCWGWWSSGFWWSNQVCTDCFTSYVAFHSQQTDDEDKKLYVQMLFAQFSFSSFLISVFSLGSKTSPLLRPSSHFLISRTYAGGGRRKTNVRKNCNSLLKFWHYLLTDLLSPIQKQAKFGRNSSVTKFSMHGGIREGYHHALNPIVWGKLRTPWWGSEKATIMH